MRLQVSLKDVVRYKVLAQSLKILYLLTLAYCLKKSRVRFEIVRNSFAFIGAFAAQHGCESAPKKKAMSLVMVQHASQAEK